MSAVTVVSLDLSFIFERWLRHKGRLHHNTSNFQKALSVLSIIAAIAGAAGLVLLAVFDTLRYPRLHDDFLVLFMSVLQRGCTCPRPKLMREPSAGYLFSAIFVCWEYQRLGHHFKNHTILRMSFYVKLAFIVIELALAIGESCSVRLFNPCC